ncbi:hypothetical protein DsansV1_C18g0151661 [Dioscorea sansibarensis]
MLHGIYYLQEIRKGVDGHLLTSKLSDATLALMELSRVEGGYKTRGTRPTLLICQEIYLHGNTMASCFGFQLSTDQTVSKSTRIDPKSATKGRRRCRSGPSAITVDRRLSPSPPPLRSRATTRTFPLVLSLRVYKEVTWAVDKR